LKNTRNKGLGYPESFISIKRATHKRTQSRKNAVQRRIAQRILKPIQGAKNKARRTQVKAHGGFFAGSVHSVRDQEKTPRNDELHSVFFVFYGRRPLPP